MVEFPDKDYQYERDALLLNFWLESSVHNSVLTKFLGVQGTLSIKTETYTKIQHIWEQQVLKIL